jgi:ribosomal protein S18 acetylase RimI-like enzyme
MKSITETIQIVQYNENLAQAIADMWNESRESWGGDASIKTEEQVKEQEANSEDLFLYLALDGDKVVGYCGISEYKEDTQALYIRLLNVHPDYHGKKIGKQLVIKAVEKTVEHGYPRIDLYTWPGNVKAVPLYKKCGFFWEDRDDTTHLMNFIPIVLQNEWTKPYFEHLDWYNDNVRAIEVKPDGIKENGFTFFEYVWKNDTHFLRVQIEKSGRGIRLIETNDVVVQVTMDDHTQIEGKESNLKLYVKNKSAEEIHVSVEGNANERIHVSREQISNVEDEHTFELPVVIKDGEEPNEWVTHPRAEIKVKVNGLSSVFAVGVYPKKAMKIKAIYQPKRYDSSQEQYCYLEIENYLKKDAKVVVELPNNPFVQWANRIFTADINEKGIIKIPFHIKKYGFLQSECTVKVQADEEVFEWQETLAFSMPHFGVKAGGHDPETFYLQNGFYKVIVRKRDNAVSFGSEQKLFQRTTLFPPKFGKPYIGELSKKRVSHFEWEHNDTTANMKLYYDITKPFAMRLALCFELYGEGLLSYWLEIENLSEKSVGDLFVYQPIRHDINQTYIPINNEIVYFNDSKMTNLGQLNSNDVTGNWIFSDDQKDPHGITWNDTVKLGFEGWFFYLEENIETVRTNEIVQTKPIHFSLGAIKTVDEFQVYAKNAISSETIAKDTELKPQSSNPVMVNDNHTNLVLKRRQNRYFDGILTLKENGQTVNQIQVQQDDNQDLIVDYQTNTRGFVPIQYNLESESQEIQGSLLLLHQDQTEIKMTKIEDDQHVIYEIKNGDLRFKTAASFFPTLYSLTYKDQEWLDSAYPKPEPKAWWNPWAGGIRSYLIGISLFSFLKETSHTRFVTKVDQLQNEWQGVVIETKMENHEKWKGLSILQYFLTLPGVPFIVHFSELKHPNRNINQYFCTEMWMKKNTLNDTVVHLQNKSGSQHFRAGFEEHDFRISNPYTLSNHEQTQSLQVISNHKGLESECVFSEEFAMTTAYTYLNIEPGTKHTTKPVFLMFTEQSFDKEILGSLEAIRF